MLPTLIIVAQENFLGYCCLVEIDFVAIESAFTSTPEAGDGVIVGSGCGWMGLRGGLWFCEEGYARKMGRVVARWGLRGIIGMGIVFDEYMGERPLFSS